MSRVIHALGSQSMEATDIRMLENMYKESTATINIQKKREKCLKGNEVRWVR